MATTGLREPRHVHGTNAGSVWENEPAEFACFALGKFRRVKLGRTGGMGGIVFCEEPPRHIVVFFRGNGAGGVDQRATVPEQEKRR